MITKIDAARICACAEEASTGTEKLLEQLDAVLADDETREDAGVRDQLKGAQLKARAAKTELERANEFACAARDASMGGAR